jgi:hypothetical protein
MIDKWRGWSGFEKLLFVALVAMVVYYAYATVMWLLSPHPVGALAPGVFLFLFASGLYARLKYATANEAVVGSTTLMLITGAASALSIVILWTLAVERDDAVYRDQAVTMSIWGGPFAILALLILLMLATPRGRRRMRAQREAVEAAPRPHPEH